MGNALKDFVSARRDGKASLVAEKVSIILRMATSCFTVKQITHCSIIETARK